MIPYFQTTSFTTAAAALLTLLHEKVGLPLTREEEFKIWRSAVLLPTRGCSIYGLARYAVDNGAKVQVIVEHKGYEFPDYRFYRYTKQDIEDARFMEEQYIGQVDVEERPITLTEIKTLLKRGKMLLLRVNAKPIRQLKRNSSQYIVVHGYQDGFYHVVDPAMSALSVPAAIIKEAFDSLATVKYRDRRMLVFS